MLNWEFFRSGDSFELRLDGKAILRHEPSRPWLILSELQAEYRMHRGNFTSRARTLRRVALRFWSAEERGASIEGGQGSIRLLMKPSRDAPEAECVTLRLAPERGSRRGPEDEGRGTLPGLPSTVALPSSLVVEFLSAPAWVNGCTLILAAEPGERAYGCGEQFSYLNLRGRRFPLWTSEQGVGRSPWALSKRLADLADGAGGEYWWTFFPQPSYVTNRRLRVHLDTDAWSDFDFRPRRSFRLSTRQLPRRLVLGSAPDMSALAADNARYFGLQPPLPDWTHDGVILGIQGGRDACLSKLEAARDAGVPVVGIWAQDWAGVRYTSFGKRLSWNWEVDEELYPELKALCASLDKQGVRFLAYVNCYFACDKPIFSELDRLGLLVKAKDGSSYRMDAGEFEAGIPDLTNPAARDWFKELIKHNLLDLGIGGWMADFGEYLPADCLLHDGSPAELAHNLWPALWARVNYEALEESGRLGDATFFMRAGYSGSQRWCPLMWAGDQNVDWSRHDGLPSVIPAALSLAVLGHGYHHSDIGGYTTLFHLKRSKELFLRWAELAAFTMVMRTHEGNRPGSNWQFDTDEDTLDAFGRMGRLRAALAPYFRELARRFSEDGEPTLRPLFMADEAGRESWGIQDQFMVGSDLLVAPVLKKGARSRRLWLPSGDWVGLWDDSRYPGRAWARVEAPLGRPPAFYRAGSPWAACFKAAAAQG